MSPSPRRRVLPPLPLAARPDRRARSARPCHTATGGGGRVPALFMLSRYHRPSAGAPVPPGAACFARHGYAVLRVDERGTGASFGAWAHPFSAQSIADAGELVDWAVAQPWSNGRVGATGVSYLGTIAHLLAATGRPAVRAVSPKFMATDL
ncbi:MAG TPA: CocE/NonD family hydrolase [Polyangiaceae bacterium]|nr:CocE/NonD family hydrolase [Polyangiaceae bacterium]